MPGGGNRKRDTAWLLEAFAAAVQDGDLDVDLVTIGKGKLARSRRSSMPPAGRVIDLGFVSDEERNNAFAAATAYVQPSRMESFSRTIMEAWLAGTPVIGLAESEVVAWHCGRSGGGLMFSDAKELASPAPLCRLQARGGHRDGRGRPALRGRELHVAHCARPHGGKLARRFMTARRALVVGSYPPVPGAAAAATVAAVRRAWDAGVEVVVVSPRPSAAPFVVPVAGTALGRELAKLRVAHACNEVVLCVEPGWPFGGRRCAGSYGRARREHSLRLLAASRGQN